MSLPVASPTTWDAGIPHTESALHLSLELEAWIRSDVLGRLAQAWGGEAPRDTASTLALFDWYDAFSLENWDFRRGRERDFKTLSGLTPDQIEACRASAEALGLVEGPTPSRQAYDYVLVLGGLARACVARTQYVADLMNLGSDFGEIVALGGTRTLDEEELEFARSRSLDVGTEFEALLEGTKLAFALRAAPEISESRPGGKAFDDWTLAKLAGPCPISVVAAPSSRPALRRANTADTFAWWAEREGNLAGKHLLVVTTPIYVPYQSAMAIENLGISYSASIETVGTSFQTASGKRHRLFTPESYLQEIRSAIRGYRSLYEKLRLVHVPD